MRVALVFLLFLLSGCGDDADGASFETPPTDEHGRYVITMTSDRAFEPAMAKVPTGAGVVFVAQLDGCRVASEPTGGPDSARGGPGTNYKNGLIDRGGEYAWLAPDSDAEFDVWCAIHEDSMRMTLRVG